MGNTMRITPEQLKIITGRSTPAAQVKWFKTHFEVQLESDSHGVIITPEVFNDIIAKRYGTSANDADISDRPKVRLQKK